MSAIKKKSKKRRAVSRKIATKQAIKPGVSPISGVAPPKSRQFGEPDGNPRHSGAWKKEDTLRYKLEKIMNGLDEAELEEILNDPKTSPGVRKLATLLYKSNYEKPEAEWRVWEGAMNQAYGLPKQSIEQTNLEPPVPLSPRSAPVMPGLRAEGAAVGKERASDTRERSERSRASATPWQTEARNTPPQGAKPATARRTRTSEKTREMNALARTFPRRRTRPRSDSDEGSGPKRERSKAEQP